MVKSIFTYFTIMYGLLLVLSLAGISTGSESLLSEIGLGSTTKFMVEVGVILGACVGIGFIISLTTKTPADIYILAGFASYTLIKFVVAFTNVITYSGTLDGWVYYIIYPIFIVLGIGFVLSVIDYVFNRGMG